MCARHNHDASAWIDVKLCWPCSWEVWRVSVCETVQSNLHVLYIFCCKQNSPSQALINFARLQKKLMLKQFNDSALHGHGFTHVQFKFCLLSNPGFYGLFCIIIAALMDSLVFGV